MPVKNNLKHFVERKKKFIKFRYFSIRIELKQRNIIGTTSYFRGK